MKYTAIKNRLQDPDNDVSVAYPECGERERLSVGVMVGVNE